MATPRIFISSTCYDLSEVREVLELYLKGLHFEIVMSDKGDVYYEPGLHTHESCIKEVSNCDLFLLIVGGRYGGKYIKDETISIVNAEYEAAISCSAPIVSFVKKDVWDNHLFFLKNKEKGTAETIYYPAIENQAFAIKIFEFLNRVRLAETNNGIFQFNTGNDIAYTLKKQFAGMIYNHLISERKLNSQNILQEGLQEVKTLASKSQELLERVYTILIKDPANAETEIRSIEIGQSPSNFFFQVQIKFGIQKIFDWRPLLLEKDFLPPNLWYDYLLKSQDFKTILRKNDLGIDELVLVHVNTLRITSLIATDSTYKQFSKVYLAFQQIDALEINDTIIELFDK